MAVSSVNARATGLARALLSRYLVLHAHRRRLSGGSAFGPSSEEVAVALRGELPSPAPMPTSKTIASPPRAAS